MKNFPQKTDSNIIHNPLDESFVQSKNGYVTHGFDDIRQNFVFLSESNPFKDVWEILPKISNPSILEQTKSLLMLISNVIGVIQEKTGGYGRIPPLHAYLVENGSVLIEWILGDFRIGFNIESNEEESGWHLVSNKNMGEITSSGQLKNKTLIVSHLIDLIIKNI